MTYWNNSSQLRNLKLRCFAEVFSFFNFADSVDFEKKVAKDCKTREDMIEHLFKNEKSTFINFPKSMPLSLS